MRQLSRALDEAFSQFSKVGGAISGLIFVVLVLLGIGIALSSSFTPSKPQTQGPDLRDAKPRDAKPAFVTAYNECVDLTKLYFRHPSSFDDKWSYMNPDLYDSNGLVRIKFSVRNEFGMAVEGDAYCNTIDGALKSTLVQMEDGTRVH